MNILVIGGTGTIGKEVVNLLKRDHHVIAIGRTSGDYQMNFENKASIEKMFNDFSDIDGIISLAGDAELAPYHSQPDDQINLAINSKLKANLNLIRVASNRLNKGGFVLLTSGMAAQDFMPGASSVSMALGGLETYVKSIQIEPYNNIRVQMIRPVVITETLKTFKLDLPYSVSARETAKIYQEVVDGHHNEVIVNVSDLIHQ